MMKKGNIKRFLSLIMLFALTFCLVSCYGEVSEINDEPGKECCLVTFIVQGIGTAPVSQEVYAGEKVQKPEDPESNIAVFEGWYKDPECTVEWNFDTDVVTGNTVLYAKWNSFVTTGKFTVGKGADNTEGTEDDVVVYFSKGSLWADATDTENIVFHFEDDQFTYPTTRESSHIGHFHWSKDAKVAVAGTYNDPNNDAADVLFTNNATDGTKPNADLTVDGKTGVYRSLSIDEWNYLLGWQSPDLGNNCRNQENRFLKVQITELGQNGVIIFPDGVDLRNETAILPDINKPALNPSHVIDSDKWNMLKDMGCVFIPASGYFDGSSIVSGGEAGYVWCSTSGNKTKVGSWYFYCNSALWYVNNQVSRNSCAAPIRLVIDAE